MLTNKDRELILFLTQHPLASFVEIANGMNIGLETAKRRLNNLMVGVDPAINGFTALTNPNVIGLETHTFVIELNNDTSNYLFDLLHRLGQIHPYTVYQNRVFGGINGMILQFDIPKGTADKITRMFYEIKQYTPIENFFHFPNPTEHYDSNADIKYWKDDSWQFNFKSWLNDSQADPNISTRQNQDMTDISQRLQMVDIILIRELTINSRRKQAIIMNDVLHGDTETYTYEEKQLFQPEFQRKISRRIKFLNDNNVFREYRLLYNRERFQIFNQMILTGTLIPEYKEAIVTAMQNQNLPFRSSFRIFDENEFLWWLNLPPSHTTDFINLMFSMSNNIKFLVLDAKPTHSLSYPIWHQNFIDREDGKGWKQEDDYIIHDPVNKLFDEE